MRAIIYFLAGVALVAAAAGAIAYGSDNLRTLSESGVAQEAPSSAQGSYGSYGQVGVPDGTQDCYEDAGSSYSYGSHEEQDYDDCSAP